MKIMTTQAQFKTIQSWFSSELPAGYAWLGEGVDITGFYQYNGCVDVTVEDNVVTAITPNVEAWEAWQVTMPDPDVALASAVRQERDALLTACDWTQMPDSPLDDDTKSAWAVYRQGLRDVPGQTGFPNDIQWPEELI